MAVYLSGEERPADNERMARYYTGEAVANPMSPTDRAAEAVVTGSLAFGAALDELLRDTIQEARADLDPDTLEPRLRQDLTDAIARARLREGQRAPVAGRRQDMAPAMMERLGIPADKPLDLEQVANLLNGTRADGEAIEGRQLQRPMRSLVDVFGLDGRRLPTAEEIDHLLDGKRADGQAPSDKDGNALPDEVVGGARKRFLAAYGAGRDPTDEQLTHIREGKTANGLEPDATAVRRALNATKAPIGYADMIWSPDKSVSVAWALAETQAERSAIEQAHNEAVAAAMGYVEHFLGVTRLGKAGAGGTERGEVAWLEFKHYASRPTYEFERVDKDTGEAYTEFLEVRTKTADPQLHTHAPLLNCVLTESGKAGAIDFDLLDGRTKEFGRIYQAVLGTKLQAIGCRVERTADGAARLADIPVWLCERFSRRTMDAKEAAREAARESGLDWDGMAPDQQRAFLRKGVETSRNRKEKGDGPAQFARWKEEAQSAGYQHQSVIGRDAAPELTRDARMNSAFAAALDLVEDAFAKKAVLNALQLREAAAASLIGLGTDNPLADVNALTQAMRHHGVHQDGETVGLIWGDDAPQRGKARISVTTQKHLTNEKHITAAARQFAADRSAALPRATVERTIGAFLAEHPELVTASKQWETQGKTIVALTDGRMLGLVIGVAGAGKSTVVAPVAAAMHAEGRTTYGLANAWKHASPLASSGVQRTASIAAFLNGIERGVHAPNSKTTVFVDEISRVGQREMLALLKAQQQHGFQLLMLGDPKQCREIEAPVMELLLDALGDQVPQILTSVRQRTERERQIAGLFREGKAAEAIKLKREDGTALLVAGGREAAIERVAKLWRERMEARGDEPRFVLTVSAPTNQDAQDIGKAIRLQARAMGRLGADQVTIEAAGPKHLGEGTSPMPLAAGDQVRVHNRIIIDRKGFASNGDVLTIREATRDGMRAINDRGDEAFVKWGQFRQKGDAGPVRLSYGYGLTIDSSQGATSGEHIDALVSGSAASQRNKAYTAESRQRDTTWLVVSEASERREVMARVPRGAPLPVLTHDDIWQNVAENLSREPTKSTATAFIERAQRLFFGTTREMQTAMVRSEQEFRAAHPEQFQGEPERQVEQVEAQSQELPEKPPEPAAEAAAPSHQERRPTAVRTLDPAEVQAQFIAAMETIGLQISGSLRADGQKHPCQVEGNKGRRKSGFYRFDGKHGFGLNSRTGEKLSWHLDGAELRPRSEAQREADRQARIERQQAQEARERAMADQAKAIWTAAAPASPGHAYLVKKQIAPGDIRQGRSDQFAMFEKEDGTKTRVSLAGRLIIPLRDADGAIWNIQAIGRDGGKLFLGGRTKGLFYQIGTPSRPDEPVILGEGFATSRTLHEISGLSAIMALNAGNLASVAEAIRKREPGRPIIVGSDNDHAKARQGKPNVGREKGEATAFAVGGIAAPPPFVEGEQGSDWNDLVTVRGRAGTREALEKGLDGIALPSMPLAPEIPDRADDAVQAQHLPQGYSQYRQRQAERSADRDLEREQGASRGQVWRQAHEIAGQERSSSLEL